MSATTLIQRIQGSQFLKNVAKISTGRLAAMAIAVIATPIVSRLFDPTHFGIAAVCIASIGMLASFMPLSYERAALFPKEGETAVELLVVALISSTLIAVLTYVVLIIAGIASPGIGQRFGIGAFIWFVPFGALLLSFRHIFGTACIRFKGFSSIAVADVAEASASALIRIGWGIVLASSAIGLLFGYAFALVIAAVLVGIPVLKWSRAYSVDLSPSKMRRLAVEYRDYPIYRAPAKFAFTGAQRLPVIALGMIFPAEIVGFYAMANRAAAMPLHAASLAVKDVLLEKIMAKRQDEKPIVKSLFIVAVGLAVTGAPVFIILFFFGEDLLAWFLGARWADAGRFVAILSPYLYLLWVGSFTATIFETLRLNKLRLKIHSANLVIRIAVFLYCGIAGLDVSQTLWSFVIVSSLYQVMVYYIAVRAAINHDRALRPSGDVTNGPGQ